VSVVTVEGYEVPAAVGTQHGQARFAVAGVSFSGRERVHDRGTHRTYRITTGALDATERAALEGLLIGPNPVKLGGTELGHARLFSVRDVITEPLPASLCRMSFTAQEVDSNTPDDPLLWAFRADAYDPNLTFTRTTGGTYTDRDGVVQDAATNVARVTWVDFGETEEYDGERGVREPFAIIEQAYTNLNSSDNIFADFTAINSAGPVTATDDPAGGTGAWNCEGSGSSSTQGWTRNFSNGGSVVHSMCAVVRQKRHPSGGDQIVGIYDNVAPAWKLWLNISGWVDGEPTVTASFGTYLGKRYVGNGYWALYGHTAALTGANQHSVRVYANDSADAASIDVYRLNVYADLPGAFTIKDQSDAHGADDWYYAAPGVTIEPLSLYVRYREIGAELDSANAGLISLSGGTTAPRLLINKPATGFRVYYEKSDTTSTNAAAVTAADWGDLVELCAQLSKEGAVRLHQSINGGTVSSTAWSTAIGLETGRDWWSDRILLGEASAGQSAFAINSVAICRGEYSLLEMRDIARATKFHRDFR
jgi:hypothetical protein